MEAYKWTIGDTLKSVRDVTKLGREAIEAVLRAIDPAEVSYDEED